MKRKILSNNLIDLIKCRGADSCNMKNGQIVAIEKNEHENNRNSFQIIDSKSKSSYSRRKIKDPALRRKYKGCSKPKNRWKRRCESYYDYLRSNRRFG